jgi:hypothetical protein
MCGRAKAAKGVCRDWRYNSAARINPSSPT